MIEIPSITTQLDLKDALCQVLEDALKLELFRGTNKAQAGLETACRELSALDDLEED